MTILIQDQVKLLLTMTACGRLSPAGLVAFLTGVLLWKKLFCDILTLGEKDEKEKQTSRVRKK